jgi:hypothetical protein
MSVTESTKVETILKCRIQRITRMGRIKQNTDLREAPLMTATARFAHPSCFRKIRMIRFQKSFPLCQIEWLARRTEIELEE